MSHRILVPLLFCAVMAAPACAVRHAGPSVPHSAKQKKADTRLRLRELARIHRDTVTRMLIVLRTVAIDASSVRILAGGSSLRPGFSPEAYRDVATRDRETVERLRRLAVIATDTSLCIAAHEEEGTRTLVMPATFKAEEQAAARGTAKCDRAIMRMRFDLEVSELDEVITRLLADLESVTVVLESSRLIRPLLDGVRIDQIQWMTERRQVYSLDSISLRAQDTRSVVRRIGFALLDPDDDGIEVALTAADDMLRLGKEWEEAEKTYDVSQFRLVVKPPVEKP